MKPISTGVTVYRPRAEWRQQPTICPVCDGKTQLIIKPIDSPDHPGHVTGCQYCQHGPRDGIGKGMVAEDWGHHPVVDTILIEGNETRTIGDKVEIRYLYNVTEGSMNLVNHEDVVLTRDFAQQVAEKMCKEANEREQAKKFEVPNPTHKIGYAKKQIRDAQRVVDQWTNYLNSQR